MGRGLFTCVTRCDAMRCDAMSLSHLVVLLSEEIIDPMHRYISIRHVCMDGCYIACLSWMVDFVLSIWLVFRVGMCLYLDLRFEGGV